MNAIFELFASLGLDTSEYDKKLKDSGEQMSGFGDKIKGGLSKVGEVASTVVKGVSVGVTVASSAIAAIGTQAVKSYAEYEQLAGGVETLFGAGGQSLEEYAKSEGKTVDEVRTEYQNLMEAQESVMANAKEAYKTAGMSANEYMDTVTSFSASLISSLGGDTKKAAVVANRAMVSMSDNANKMGTSMESIQNAYQGFAKQNYTIKFIYSPAA